MSYAILSHSIPAASVFVSVLLLFPSIEPQPLDLAYAEKLLNETVNVSALVTFALAEQYLVKIEKNLQFYEKTKWGLDLRASYQLFMVQLQLKAALNSSNMGLYNKDSPLKKRRLEKIVLKSQELASFIRYRILARVPRKNLTRLVSALFVFTPTPWEIFLPALPTEGERKNWTEYLSRTLRRKLNQSEIPVFPSAQDYVRDLVGDTNEARLAYNVSVTCLRTVTMNPINDTALSELMHQKLLLNGSLANVTSATNDTLDMKRILLLTTARLARNCYFISPSTDLKIIHYLCFLAHVQIDKLKSIKPASINPSFYKDLDSLTKHDFANICLLNGLPQFLLQDLMDCDDGELVWYKDVGCYGPKGAGKPKTPKPLPWWIIMRPNMHENKVCNRHQTAACFAYYAASLRALVELGSLKASSATTNTTTTTTTTEFFPD